MHVHKLDWIQIIILVNGKIVASLNASKENDIS